MLCFLFFRLQAICPVPDAQAVSFDRKGNISIAIIKNFEAASYADANSWSEYQLQVDEIIFKIKKKLGKFSQITFILTYFLNRFSHVFVNTLLVLTFADERRQKLKEQEFQGQQQQQQPLTS